MRLLNEETREPLAGVLVAALGAGDAVGPTTLSSGDGIATVHSPSAGPLRLLIRRIGFAPVTTDSIAEPPAGRTVDVVVAAHRITLTVVHVVGSAGCASDAESPSPGAAAAWTEVRNALEASTLTRDQRLVTTAAFRFQRQLRADGTVDYADTTLRGRSGERPFVAPAPAVLERDGYFKQHDDGSENFFAPDEAVILSTGFTRHHCVTVLPDVRRDSTGTQIALAFVPRDHDTRPEIKGLIWIDSATSELRRVDFEYVRVPLPAPADSLGGTVAFQHLASGAWIVSAWTLRIPRWRMVDQRRNYVLLDGYNEVGGTASVVRDLATPGPTVPRVIAGTVFDSVGHRPLAGAHVHLTDLARDATTDALGAFRFDSVLAGVHTLWVDHPVLDSLGLFALATRVDATPQLVTSAVLASPSFATLWRRACGSAPGAEHADGFVFGTVRADSAGAPGAATVVTISWVADTARDARASHMTVTADSTGNYAACGVPRAAGLTISAAHGALATVPARFRLGGAAIARRDLTLPSRAATVAEGVADSSSGAGTMHRLRVVSADGRPVVYANVRIAGGLVQITNEKGEIPLGTGRIHMATASIRRIGFTPWFGTIDFPDTASAVTVTLAHVAQYLGEVRITGQKNPSSPFVQGFYDRWLDRQKGLLSAVFIGPEELEARHPDKITGMLYGLNGVCMYPPLPKGPVIYSSHSGSLMLTNSSCQNCPMAIVVDGMQQYPPPGGNVHIDEVLDANDVMAIEVYDRAGNMPVSLQVNDSKCGVVAFWTGARR
ncbi:MAG: carboxypeptidase regulatory-like domain-containing protein [Gemmatimonadales bacterium]